jgi:hypothetical protein
MEFPDTGIAVTLSTAQGAVRRVSIRSGRLVRAAALFAGRTPAQVLTLLPTVFSLCGTAQALTGLTAMETAAGLTATPATRQARRILVLAETIAEHGLTLCRDWPPLLGEAPDLDAARRWKQDFGAIRPLLYPDGDALSPGGGRLAPDRAAQLRTAAAGRDLLDHVLGAPADSVLADAAAFAGWLKRAPGACARLLAEAGWPCPLGTPTPMPPAGPADLDLRLRTDRNGDYLARPDSAGIVCETGAFARRAGHPLVAALNGFAAQARLTARLVDMAAALRELAGLVQDLTGQPAGPVSLTDGTGLATTEAARGLLAHRVSLEGGRVSDYRILAPTEWNFHPDGPLARTLAGLTADAGLERRAVLLVNAFDPCVPCRVTVE